MPRPVEVTPQQAQREGLESLDEDYPPARRRADADVLALLGLIPRETDLGEAYESALGEAVAGYYDPRKDRLRIVKGAQTANRVLYEMVLAHELTHVLEDQRFEFDLDALAAGGDRALAHTALIEGTASALMYRYVDARFGAEELFGGLAASAFQGTGDLPPFLTAQLLFPYTAGETFVRRLLEVGDGRWKVVDAALRFRPPASTEQILHPGAYLKVEQPRRVSLARAGRGARPRLAACAARDVRRVADAEAARARRRHRLGEGGRRLGRRPLRAAGPRRRARARHALDLGHGARPRRVRRGAAGVGARRACRARRRPAAIRGARRTARRRSRGAARRSRSCSRPMRRSRAGPRAPTSLRRGGPVAQRSEQRAHNPTDGGSNPPRPIRRAGARPRTPPRGRRARPSSELHGSTFRTSRTSGISSTGGRRVGPYVRRAAAAARALVGG